MLSITQLMVDGVSLQINNDEASVNSIHRVMPGDVVCLDIEYIGFVSNLKTLCRMTKLLAKRIF